MTTIAYRDGVIAADTSMTAGSSRQGRVVKVAANDMGQLAGAAGRATYMAAFLAWFSKGCWDDPPKAEKTDDQCDRGIVVHWDGSLTVYEDGGSFDLTAPYYAIGSGKPEALGALFAGADAETAVRAAMEHDTFTAGDITVVARRGGE